MIQQDLRKAERRTFRAAADLGTWDLLIATGASMFAIAPLLSPKLGDFWSSAIFIPVFAVMFVILRFVRQRLFDPRIGVVRFGSYRQTRLRRLVLVLAVVNVVALTLGAIFAARFQPAIGPAPLILFSALVLVAFSLAAYFLNIPRYFGYGLFLAAAPFVGEWLFREGHASHHGFPVVFGVAAVVIATVGLATLLVRFRSLGPQGDASAIGDN